MSRYQIDTDVLSRQCKVDDQHLWGREILCINTDEYCGKLIELIYPARSSVHYHEDKQETFTVLNGIVTIQVGDTMRDYRAGESVTIMPDVRHSFMLARNGKSRKALLLETSTHHESSDTKRVQPSMDMPVNGLLGHY